MIKLNKPSDSLSRDDISNMRRGNQPSGHNGNDWRYGGSRGMFCIIKVQLECTWEDEEVEDDQNVFGKVLLMLMSRFWKILKDTESVKIKVNPSYDSLSYYEYI